jgi:hypothetical protein
MLSKEAQEAIDYLKVNMKVFVRIDHDNDWSGEIKIRTTVQVYLAEELFHEDSDFTYLPG